MCSRGLREFRGRRLVWNVFFYGSHLGLFIFGWWKQASDPKLAGLNTLKFSVWFSRGAGLCLGYDGALITLPGTLQALSVKSRFIGVTSPPKLHHGSPSETGLAPTSGREPVLPSSDRL